MNSMQCGVAPSHSVWCGLVFFLFFCFVFFCSPLPLSFLNPSLSQIVSSSCQRGTSLRSSIILDNVDPLAAAEAEAAEARGEAAPEDPTPLDFAFRDVDDVTFAMQLALKGQELFAALSHREVCVLCVDDG